MINARLIVVGGAKQTVVTLRKLPTTIGRSKEASITLPHSLVSRQHCEIFEEQGILYVRDLNSLNGTFLNNEKINGSRPLLPDQLLTLGNVTFRAAYEVDEIDLHDAEARADAGSWTDDGLHSETVAAEILALQVANSSPDDGSVDDDNDESTSPILVFDDENPSPSPSISLGAINELPQVDKAAQSDVNVRIDAEGSPAPQFETGKVKIETGEDTEEKASKDDTLNSFIRKLPK